MAVQQLNNIGYKHCELTPENIIQCGNGADHCYKLIGFVADDSDYNKLGKCNVITPPEYILGKAFDMKC